MATKKTTNVESAENPRTTRDGTEPCLRTESISKSFRNVQALSDISISMYPGEVIGLVGENGAGKSTLLNILTGILTADEGQLYVHGEPVEFTNPREAAERGVSLVHQEIDVLPNFRGYENLFLGREKDTIGLLNQEEMRNEAQAFVDDLGLDIDVNEFAQNYSFNEHQMLEIAKAFHISRDAENPVILLDEPTSGLEEAGREILFEKIDELRDQATFVFVSHELDEILEITDRIYVLKDGKLNGEFETESTTEEDLQQSMVGRETASDYYRVPDQTPASEFGASALEVDGICYEDEVGPVSFSVERGEIFGIVGVEGSGKQRLGRLLAGALPATDGRIVIDDTEVVPNSPADMVDAGVGYIPKDRKSEGLLLYQSVLKNTSLAMVRDMFGRLPFLNMGAERTATEEMIEELNIKTPGSKALVHGLSGGNQQKVVLGRWLARETPVLVMDNVTRGIAIGAKEEAYRLLRELTDAGISIVLIGDEMPEVIGLSNRIGVMADGTFAGSPVDSSPDNKPAEEELIQRMI